MLSTIAMRCCVVLLVIFCIHTASASGRTVFADQRGPLSILKVFSRSAVYLDDDLDSVLRSSSSAAAAVLVLTGSGEKPHRRKENQAILSFSHAVQAVLPEAVQQSLLVMMQQVESLRGRRLYPLLLDTFPGNACQQSGVICPWAVVNLSRGHIMLHSQLLNLLGSSPVETATVLINSCLAQLEKLIKQESIPSNVWDLTRMLSAAVTAGLTTAYTTAGASPPRWFCFMCPIILGLLAPLVINAGVGEAADMACKAMQLPDDECVDLWFTALALGLIISLLSAIPIYKVCRLYKCAHPHPITVRSQVM